MTQTRISYSARPLHAAENYIRTGTHVKWLSENFTPLHDKRVCAGFVRNAKGCTLHPVQLPFLE
ncbi:hypothetical protein NTG1052_520004 [Candidatus Nitrotoga sp. 1052]|nr:hypothetical protein NTG1052_520004 [Candidatus Nitrotoga sp. 1052]